MSIVIMESIAMTWYQAGFSSYPVGHTNTSYKGPSTIISVGPLPESGETLSPPPGGCYSISLESTANFGNYGNTDAAFNGAAGSAWTRRGIG
jgi:hypothetical protein